MNRSRNVVRKNKAKKRKGKGQIDLKISKKTSERNNGETKNKKLKKGLSIDKAKEEIVNKIVT